MTDSGSVEKLYGMNVVFIKYPCAVCKKFKEDGGDWPKYQIATDSLGPDGKAVGLFQRYICDDCIGKLDGILMAAVDNIVTKYGWEGQTCIYFRSEDDQVWVGTLWAYPQRYLWKYWLTHRDQNGKDTVLSEGEYISIELAKDACDLAFKKLFPGLKVKT